MKRLALALALVLLLAVGAQADEPKVDWKISLNFGWNPDIKVDLRLDDDCDRRREAGYLGIDYEEARVGLPFPVVRVVRVHRYSPADDAGLRSGDLILFAEKDGRYSSLMDLYYDGFCAYDRLDLYVVRRNGEIERIRVALRPRW